MNDEEVCLKDFVSDAVTFILLEVQSLVEVQRRMLIDCVERSCNSIDLAQMNLNLFWFWLSLIHQLLFVQEALLQVLVQVYRDLLAILERENEKMKMNIHLKHLCFSQIVQKWIRLSLHLHLVVVHWSEQTC